MHSSITQSLDIESNINSVYPKECVCITFFADSTAEKGESHVKNYMQGIHVSDSTKPQRQHVLN